MTEMTAESFIRHIRDEADTIREHLDGYYSIENEVKPNFERPIGNLDQSRRIRSLKVLHAALNRANQSKNILDDDNDNRHYLFTQIFGRTITSANQITNVEAIAFNNCCNRYNLDAARNMVDETLDSRFATLAI